MIRSIYFERYKKVLIAVCLLVIGICTFTAILQNNQWKSVYNDPELKTQYDAIPDEHNYYDEKQMNSVPYKSYKDFRDATLFFYGSFSLEDSGPNLKTMAKVENYSNKIPYSPKFGGIFIRIALLFVVPLAGFLLFFIDQKTGFNQFLFSLGISRKELFKKKITYVALPFLLSILIGQSLYALLIHSLIPAYYMNATLGQLFTSVISNFCLLFFMFSSSAFIGSMVGNSLFGSLTWAVYWWLMIIFPASLYRFGNILHTAKLIPKNQFPETLFVYFVGKMGGFWWVNLLFVFLGLLIAFWAYKKYQTLSLENDNAYLLHKESRWPIWTIMTLFTSFILNTYFFDSWSYFLQKRLYEHSADSISGPIFSNILITLVVGCICLLIVFYREITLSLSSRLNNLNHRTE